MEMADGDGERVSGVGGVGGEFEAKEASDHELNLLLGGEAVADDCGFDGQRRVFGYGLLRERGGKEGDPADLAELERGLGVCGEEDLFDGDDVGGVEFDEGSEFGEDLGEAFGGGVLLVEADGSGGAMDELSGAGVGIELDDAVAGELGAAVDAEDAHGRSLAGCDATSRRRRASRVAAVDARARSPALMVRGPLTEGGLSQKVERVLPDLRTTSRRLMGFEGWPTELIRGAGQEK